MTAVIPHLAKHGVTLVRCWISAIGQYRKVVSVWEAPSHSDFLAALSDPMLQKYRDPANALSSATIFASLIVRDPRRSARTPGVMASLSRAP